MRRPCTWLSVALLGGVLLAGCGGSSKSKSSSAPSSTSSQTSKVAGATTPSGPRTETGGATPTHPLTPKQQVEACKRTVLAPSPLSAAAKAKLLKSCNQVGGNATAQRRVVHEACEA